MNKYDLEHKLLKGSPLLLGDIPTYKVTLGEMADLGFNQVQNIISVLCMDDEKASELLNGVTEYPSTFVFVMLSLLQEQKSDNNEDLIGSLLLKFLSLVFKRDVVFDINHGFIIGDNVLNDKNYDNFRTILKERNCLVDLGEIDEFDNPDSDIAKKLLEKRKKFREKLNKAKKNGDDESLFMSDLISIFAQSQHVALQDVYDKYDMYQFNNQFNRLKIMDDFHVNIQALLAGAISDDVKLQHWLSKIKRQDN